MSMCVCVCVRIGEEETDNEAGKLYHCKQEPRAEFPFNVLGKDSASILVIYAAQRNISH